MVYLFLPHNMDHGRFDGVFDGVDPVDAGACRKIDQFEVAVVLVGISSTDVFTEWSYLDRPFSFDLILYDKLGSHDNWKWAWKIWLGSAKLFIFVAHMQLDAFQGYPKSNSHQALNGLTFTAP